MLSVLLSLCAAQRPRIAHANCHQCLHLHPSKHSSLMLASLDMQTFTMLCFTQFPTCRNKLQRLNCPNSAGRPSTRLMATLFCRKSQACGHPAVTGRWHQACQEWCDHQPIDQKSSTSGTFHSSMIFIPFIFLILFRKKHQSEASDCWRTDKLPAC